MQCRKEGYSVMKKLWLSGSLLSAVVVLALAAPRYAGAQAKGNLFKDVMDRKDGLNWKPAPEGQPPADVCSMLQACAGSMKVLVQTPVTEGGKRITRAMYMTKSADGKHDVIILERLSPGIEAYFFLLAPDGTMSKAAYDQTGQPLMSIGSAVGGPAFEQDLKVWEPYITKVSTAPPAAATPAEPKS